MAKHSPTKLYSSTQGESKKYDYLMNPHEKAVALRQENIHSWLAEKSAKNSAMPTGKVSLRTRKIPASSMKCFWACHCCSVMVGPANKYGGWKGGGWLCGVLGLPLMFCDGRSSRIGAGSFYCGDLSGGFCGEGVERWDWQVAFGVVLATFGCWVLEAFGGG